MYLNNLSSRARCPPTNEMKHNNAVPDVHAHKDWARRVRTHFDQPGRKLRRRNARLAKAAKVAPRPMQALRPVVRCPTIKYNMRIRAGRGFTLEELKVAGIPRKFARTVGIAVDHRRRNRSQESLDANVETLNQYKEKLILFPRRNGKEKKGDADKSARQSVEQGKASVATVVVEQPPKFEERKITEEEKNFNAYAALRKARSDARLVGVRAKRAKAKEEDGPAKK